MFAKQMLIDETNHAFKSGGLVMVSLTKKLGTAHGWFFQEESLRGRSVDAAPSGSSFASLSVDTSAVPDIDVTVGNFGGHNRFSNGKIRTFAKRFHLYNSKILMGCTL